MLARPPRPGAGKQVTTMATEGYRPARLRTIALGIAVFVLALIVVCSLSQGVKWTGAVLLFLPDRLGLVHTVRPAEVLVLDLRHSPAQVAFSRAGRYQLYTSDYDLLVIAAELARSGAPAWVTITDAKTGAPVTVTHIERGLLPFDTPHASGRPVLGVEIPEPGAYFMDFPTRQATLSVVPDYITGHEGVMYAAFAVEVLLLSLPFAVALYRREMRLRVYLRERRRHSQQQFEKIRRLAQGQDAIEDDR
jgi:hypothetical protein